VEISLPPVWKRRFSCDRRGEARRWLILRDTVRRGRISPRTDDGILLGSRRVAGAFRCGAGEGGAVFAAGRAGGGEDGGGVFGEGDGTGSVQGRTVTVLRSAGSVRQATGSVHERRGTVHQTAVTVLHWALTVHGRTATVHLRAVVVHPRL
jgi:hypothetical protein